MKGIRGFIETDEGLVAIEKIVRVKRGTGTGRALVYTVDADCFTLDERYESFVERLAEHMDWWEEIDAEDSGVREMPS